MNQRGHRLAFVVLCGLSAISSVGALRTLAQEQPAKKPGTADVKDGKGKWVPLFDRHAGQYSISVGSSEKAEATRLAEPSLRWWQPVRGGDDGAVYLWVRAGRPVAAVTFFT